MNRRELLEHGARGIGALGLAALPGGRRALAAGVAHAPDLLVPLRISPDRIFRTTVCLRPFRAAGPRIETEEVGRKLVVHNYGHGGSGWSLSWGSAIEAVKLALASGHTDIAIIGAGALGLTAALTAQRMGANVTIYAKEQFPYVRSARATGTWSPDSRVALEKDAPVGFAERWEQMTRASFSMFQNYLGMPGDPVEWTDRYGLSDLSPAERAARPHASDTAGFLHLEDRLQDISPRSVPLGPGEHPFSSRFAYRNSSLTFNVANLGHQLMTDFLVAGGKIIPTEFHAPSELSRLKQKVIINCTGYGARALWKDESIVPVRGQITWLIPQAGAHYGVSLRSLSVLARRDGIVVQETGETEMFGYNDANEEPDRAAAEASVRQAMTIYPAGPAATSPAS